MKSKILNKVSQFNTYIENIKEWQWLLITFIICFVAIISISIPILWQPYIHAEDGTQFLKDALFEGKSSIFKTFGGYLGVLPRLSALIAIYLGRKFNSMVLVTYVMKFCSTIFTIIVINYFNSKEFKHLINSRILRLITSILLMFVMANHGTMIYTSITLHWWSGLLAVLIGLNFINKKFPSLYIVPFLLLSILSSPSALIVVIPMIYYLFIKIKLLKDKNKKEVIMQNKMKVFMLILIVITVIIEIYAMLFLSSVVRSMNGNNISVGNVYNVIKNTIKATMESIPYILTHGKLIGQRGRLILGTLIFGVLLWRYIYNKNIKVFIWGISSMIILYFISYYKMFAKFKFPNEWFYCSIQATTGIFLIIKCLYDDFYKKNKILKTTYIIILIVMVGFFYKYTLKPEYKFCDNVFSIESDVNFSSDKIVGIEISPNEKWVTYVPVN